MIERSGAAGAGGGPQLQPAMPVAQQVEALLRVALSADRLSRMYEGATPSCRQSQMETARLSGRSAGMLSFLYGHRHVLAQLSPINLCWRLPLRCNGARPPTSIRTVTACCMVRLRVCARPEVHGCRHRLLVQALLLPP